MAETFTSSDFHNAVHKQILNAVFETMADGKLPWELIAPFLEAAHAVCRSDFDNASIRLHTVRAEGDQWVEAEEAFLGISVADRDNGEEWLSQTWWLSEIATADDDAEKVRRIAAGLERSLDRIKAWLAEREEGGPAERKDGDSH